ncbi:fetal and adult testis-expressed transcript protein isoform X2 [Tamandua tetradactyla]|uniref:fetal and adult testis-expressed transcript protein isoform X2 n=1 Tax=Tamandua tetradactyla TaxID=48850 RepID=UPI004053D0D9
MAGEPTNTKEEMEMPLAKEVSPQGQGQSQECLTTAEMTEQGYWSLGVYQRRQNLELKTVSCVLAPPVWNMTDIRPKKMGTQLPSSRMSREPGHGDAHEYSRSFQVMRFQYERNQEANEVTENGLEELNEPEMEVMRNQLCIVTTRLQALENQGAMWRHREALFFIMLVSAFIANLWLWMLL